MPVPNKYTIPCDPAGNQTQDPWLKDERANEWAKRGLLRLVYNTNSLIPT